jgi:hypothetical protein
MGAGGRKFITVTTHTLHHKVLLTNLPKVTYHCQKSSPFSSHARVQTRPGVRQMHIKGVNMSATPDW